MHKRRISKCNKKSGHKDSLAQNTKNSKKIQFSYGKWAMEVEGMVFCGGKEEENEDGEECEESCARVRYYRNLYYNTYMKQNDKDELYSGERKTRLRNHEYFLHIIPTSHSRI